MAFISIYKLCRLCVWVFYFHLAPLTLQMLVGLCHAIFGNCFIDRCLHGSKKIWDFLYSLRSVLLILLLCWNRYRFSEKKERENNYESSWLRSEVVASRNDRTVIIYSCSCVCTVQLIVGTHLQRTHGKYLFKRPVLVSHWHTAQKIYNWNSTAYNLCAVWS